MTYLQSFICQALKDLGLEKMSMTRDPRRQKIALRVFDLAMSWLEENEKSFRSAPSIEQSRLEVLE